MDMIAYPPTPTLTFLSLGIEERGRGGTQGSSDWTHGGIYVLTPLQIITPNLPFGIALLGIHLQCYKGSH